MTSALDRAALDKLQQYRGGQLARIRTRAEKWIPGLAAVTAVLGTALVVKGSETFSGLADSTQMWIIALILITVVALAVGVLFAYSAAHGNPFDDDKLAKRADDQNVENAYIDWMRLVREQVDSARRNLAIAVIATVVGTATLSSAVVVTWLAPNTYTCIEIAEEVVKIQGVEPTVVDGELKFTDCD